MTRIVVRCSVRSYENVPLRSAARSASPSSTACRRSCAPSSVEPQLDAAGGRLRERDGDVRRAARGASPGRAPRARSGTGPSVRPPRAARPPAGRVSTATPRRVPRRGRRALARRPRNPPRAAPRGSKPATRSRRSTDASRDDLARPRRRARERRRRHPASNASIAASSICPMRREMLHGPVVNQLREPAPLVALGPEALAEAIASAARRVRSIDHRVAQRDRDRLRPGLRLELREDVAHVALHRLLGDEELGGHVRVRVAVGEQLQDLPLARCEDVAAVASRWRARG